MDENQKLVVVDEKTLRRIIKQELKPILQVIGDYMSGNLVGPLTVEEPLASDWVKAIDILKLTHKIQVKARDIKAAREAGNVIPMHRDGGV